MPEPIHHGSGGCPHDLAVGIRLASWSWLHAGLWPPPIDEFLAKIEELVARSGGRVRADVVHRRITTMGFAGGERTTRRAVAEVKARFAAGQRRVFRPWIPSLN